MRIAAALLFTCASLAVARAAHADDLPTLSGSWSATSFSESWSIGDWGDACGPKPAPQGAGGGVVQIEQTGSELTMVGAGRTFSTGECWEQMPGMSRSSHSGGARGWRNTCATPANDARQAQVVTSISATDSSISIVETGQYRFSIQGQACAASVRRSRALTLLHREGDPEPSAAATATATSTAPIASAAPAPTATSKGRCAGGGGEPARLEVRPGKKLMKAGEVFAFRAIVLDAEGCNAGARPSFHIAPGDLAAKATVDASGEVTIAADADDGVVKLAVTVKDKSVVIPIDVARADKYDAMLAARDASADEEAAVVTIAVGAIGGRSGFAKDAAKQQKITFIAIIAGAATCLAFLAIALSRRGKHRLSTLPPESLRSSIVEEPPPSSTFSVPMPPPEPEPPPAPPPLESRPRARKPRGKICPTCGEHYPPEATFCGKDATTLVLLN